MVSMSWRWLLVIILSLAVGLVSCQDCEDGEVAPCDAIAQVKSPDEGVDYLYSNEASLDMPGPMVGCGPRCSICGFGLCFLCSEGFELRVGKCLVNVNFDDLTGAARVDVPMNYRGLKFNNFRAMNARKRGNGWEETGFFYGRASNPRVGYNGGGDPARITAPPMTYFSVLSMQITPGLCTPLVVTFRGEKLNGDYVYYSEVLQFTPGDTDSHQYNLNLGFRGFLEIRSLQIATFRFNNDVCPYTPGGGKRVAIDDIILD